MKERFMNWMQKNNRLFSDVAREKVTNAQVVYAHVGIVAVLIVMGLVGH